MTEEIPIDTSQAMDVLASSNNEISIDNTQTTDIVADSSNETTKESIDSAENVASDVVEDSVKSQTTEIVNPVLTKNSASSEDSKTSSTDENQLKTLNENNSGPKSGSKPSTKIENETAQPNVIVVDPLSDNAQSYLEQQKARTKGDAAKVKGRLLEISRNSLKPISSGQVVHVPIIKTVNNERNKVFYRREVVTEKGTSKSATKHETKETKSRVEIETESCTDELDKYNARLNTNIGGKSPVAMPSKLLELSTKDIITGDKYNLLKVKDINASDTSLAKTISSALGRKVEIKVPMESETVTKEKYLASEIDGDEMNSSEEAKACIRSHRLTNESETSLQGEETDAMTEVIPIDSIQTVVELAENQENAEIGIPGKENIEFVNITTDIAEPYTVEVSDRVENSDQILVNCDTSFSKSDSLVSQIDHSKTAVQTSFCEVIEYDGKRKAALPQPLPTVPPYDYVVLGDSVIEISKPHPLHGRIQQTKKGEIEPRSGNVELVLMNEPKESKSTAGG